MKKDKALRWPYGIALSFLGVIALIYFTVMETMKYPVESSDMNMQNYHVYDKNANDIILKKLDFDKKYKLTFISRPISTKETKIEYKIVTTKDAQAVNTAEIKAVITRPDEHKYDINLENPQIKEGVYSFKSVTLPKEGRWNILASVKIGDDLRYLNLKADTRNPNTFEY